MSVEKTKCPVCEGAGKYKLRFGAELQWVKCQRCEGTGRTAESVERKELSPSSCMELSGCPFCDELPEYQPLAQGHAPEYHWPHQIVHNCKVIGQQICVRAKHGETDTKETVFRIWNTRAAGQPSAPGERPPGKPTT